MVDAERTCEMTKARNLNVPITVERDGKEFDLVVECSVTPGHPGRTSGPPEKCFPPEDPEVDVQKIFFDRSDRGVWADELTEEEFDALREKAVDQLNECLASDADAAADAEMERRQDDVDRRDEELVDQYEHDYDYDFREDW